MRSFFVVLLVLGSSCEGELRWGSSAGSPWRAPGARHPDGGFTRAPVEVVTAPAQVRVLSAKEYRNTVRDLLGLTTSATLTHADWTGGYDNGAALTVDDNLFSALLTEAESLSQQYVATRLRTDFACFDPASISDGCVRTVMSQLGRRAYRKPLSPAQHAELFTFFQTAATQSGQKRVGIEVLIARMLTSPHLLYRTEVGQRVQPGGDRFALDDFEKATLVAYTLTGTMPDELLLTDAEAGRLDDTNLRAHIRRLWASPRTRERQADFFRQWLKVTALDRMARQPGDFVKLPSPETGASLKAEFDAFVGAVIFDGTGTLPALFSESFSFVDRHTAPLYGLTSTLETPTRVALDATQRRGILTLASTMAAISSATDPLKDRPVLRGLMVKNQLLCEEVGSPSGVNTVAAGNTAALTPDFDQLTTREQYEAMMQQGAECRACHRQFMPLGFAFGKYDALGRYRTTQHGRPVDSAVADVPFSAVNAGFSGAQELASAIAGNPKTTSCFSRNFLEYALGNAAAPHTQTLSDSLLENVGTDSVTVAQLVEETLASPHLYVRLGTAAPVTTADAGPATSVLLASGQSLRPGDDRRSTDGAFSLLYQLDGNLVLYRVNGPPLWSSRTLNETTGSTQMQGDGNLVVYDASGQPRFSAGMQGNPGAALHLDATGQLHILATDGRVLWSSTGSP